MMPTVGTDDMRLGCLIQLCQKPSDYPYVACRAAIADELRSCGGRNGSRLHVTGFGIGETGDSPLQTDHAESHVRAVQAVRALSSLPDAQRRIIAAIVDHGGKTEAARALGISQSRVSYALRRTRLALAEVVDHA